MQPFHADFLHPTRGALQGASVVVERGAHTQHHGIDAATVGGHPGFLLGAAQADEHHLRARLVDAVDVSLVFGFIGHPKRWRGHAGDGQARELGLDAQRQALEHFRRAAIEVHALAEFFSNGQVAPHQIGPADAFLFGVALATQGPGDWRAIGQGQVGLRDHATEIRLLAGRDHRVDVAKRHHTRLAMVGPVHNARHHVFPRDGIDVRIQNMCTATHEQLTRQGRRRACQTTLAFANRR